MEHQFQEFSWFFVFPCSVLSPSSWFAFDVFPVILLLYLKDSKFVMGSALLLAVGGLLPTGGLRGGLLGAHPCNNSRNCLLFFCNFHCIQANCTLELQHLDLLHSHLIHYWSLTCN